jgi:hypothetical protein
MVMFVYANKEKEGRMIISFSFILPSSFLSTTEGQQEDSRMGHSGRPPYPPSPSSPNDVKSRQTRPIQWRGVDGCPAVREGGACGTCWPSRQHSKHIGQGPSHVVGCYDVDKTNARRVEQRRRGARRREQQARADCGEDCETASSPCARKTIRRREGHP